MDNNDDGERSAEDLTPEELEDLARQCLAEVLNAAANVAEMQLDDDCREEIYAMCDLVSSYYGIERTLLDEQGNPVVRDDVPIPGVLRTGRLGDRFRVVDSDEDQDDDDTASL